PMQIIPAVDVLDGQVVRLLKGDYRQSTTYGSAPAEAARSWAAAGASLVHVVDLEGARLGSPSLGLVEQIASTNVPFQIGGGVRSVQAARRVIEAGAQRVVLGSVAVWQPEVLAELVGAYGADRMVAAVDVKAGLATGSGWLDAGRPYLEVIAGVAATGVGWILTTGISQDGTMAGPDLGLTRSAVEQAGNAGVIGSGGVGSLADLVALAGCGASGVVVGKALYEGVFSLQEAINAVSG
ncbi:MAG: HisA/HisF-related TIM barrel protein, partial [Acidimicrobiia bacterium]|nr:HisA/HisF-related TIM barrel protein [Acidimicrobiia bacterium]